MPRPKRKRKEPDTKEAEPVVKEEQNDEPEYVATKPKRAVKIAKQPVQEEEEEDEEELSEEMGSAADSTMEQSPADQAVSSSSSLVKVLPQQTNHQTRVPPDNLYIWKCGYCNRWSSTTSAVSDHAKIVHSAKPKYVVYLKDRLAELCEDGVLQESGEIDLASPGNENPLKETIVLPSNFSVKSEPPVDEQGNLMSEENSSASSADHSSDQAAGIPVKSEPEDDSYEVYVNPNVSDDGVKVEKAEEDMESNYVDDNLPVTFVKSEDGASGDAVSKPAVAAAAAKQEGK